MKRDLWVSIATAACIVFLSGCASTPKTYPGPDGISYQQDKALQKVWMAEGFTFANYDTIYIAETGAMIAPTREQNQAFETNRRLLHEEFAAAMQEKRLFRHVVTRETDIPVGAKVLKLETAITEFARDDSDRQLVSVYGRLIDQTRPVLQFEARRKAGSRSSAKQNKEIQLEDIRSMAKALAEYIRLKLTGQPASTTPK